MTKTLSYPAFIIASLIIVMVFVSVKTYSQLAAAAVLYPILIFLGFMIFPRSGWKMAKIEIPQHQKFRPNKTGSSEARPNTAHVTDIDKRVFIKLIGATGISFFLFSIFGRKIESLIYGQGMQGPLRQPAGIGSDQFGLATASPTDGYKISEIEEGVVSYFGFTNQQGAWLIMKQAEDGNTFRYAKGGSDFPKNWKGREDLKYDYFHNLF